MSDLGTHRHTRPRRAVGGTSRPGAFEQAWAVAESRAERLGRLIIVCGLPGSGKSTLAERLEVEYRAVRFCPDDCMSALGVDLFGRLAVPLTTSSRRDASSPRRRASSAIRLRTGAEVDRANIALPGREHCLREGSDRVGVVGRGGGVLPTVEPTGGAVVTLNFG